MAADAFRRLAGKWRTRSYSGPTRKLPGTPRGQCESESRVLRYARTLHRKTRHTRLQRFYFKHRIENQGAAELSDVRFTGVSFAPAITNVTATLSRSPGFPIFLRAGEVRPVTAPIEEPAEQLYPSENRNPNQHVDANHRATPFRELRDHLRPKAGLHF